MRLWKKPTRKAKLPMMLLSQARHRQTKSLARWNLQKPACRLSSCRCRPSCPHHRASHHHQPPHHLSRLTRSTIRAQMETASLRLNRCPRPLLQVVWTLPMVVHRMLASLASLSRQEDRLDSIRPVALPRRRRAMMTLILNSTSLVSQESRKSAHSVLVATRHRRRTVLECLRPLAALNRLVVMPRLRNRRLLVVASAPRTRRLAPSTRRRPKRNWLASLGSSSSSSQRIS